MPIPLEEYHNLKGKELKSNQELLEWMGDTQAYTTTEVEKFLGIQHPAALQRLKRLKALGYIELKMDKKTHYWKRLKKWEETDISVEPDYSNYLDPNIAKKAEQKLEEQRLAKINTRRKAAESGDNPDS